MIVCSITMGTPASYGLDNSMDDGQHTRSHSNQTLRVCTYEPGQEDTMKGE